MLLQHKAVLQVDITCKLPEVGTEWIVKNEMQFLACLSLSAAFQHRDRAFQYSGEQGLVAREQKARAVAAHLASEADTSGLGGAVLPFPLWLHGRGRAPRSSGSSRACSRSRAIPAVRACAS